MKETFIFYLCSLRYFDVKGIKEYYKFKKSWPISYSKLINKIGQDLLDIQYTYHFSQTIQLIPSK